MTDEQTGTGQVAIVTYNGEPKRSDPNLDTSSVTRVGVFKRGQSRVVPDIEYAEFFTYLLNGNRKEKGLAPLFTVTLASREEAQKVIDALNAEEIAADPEAQRHERVRQERIAAQESGKPVPNDPQHRRSTTVIPNSQTAAPAHAAPIVDHTDQTQEDK